MLRIGILAPLFASVLLAAPASGDPSTDDLDRHQGTWILVSEEIDGKATPRADLEGTTRVVTGNRVTRKAGELTGHSLLYLNASMQPRQYNAEILDGPGKGKVIRGIYDFDGDQLKMCADLSGKARPTKFATSSGSGLSFQTWRRSRP